MTVSLTLTTGATSVVTLPQPSHWEELPPIIPANQMTTGKRVSSITGALLLRTTIYKTLSPSGGDNTAAIQAALNTCPANQVVQLAAGTFRISGNGLNLTTSNITLRGAGAGTGASGGSKSEWTAGNPNGSSHLVGGGTGTFLLKADRETNTNYGILYVGNDPTVFSKSINLTANTVLNAFTCTVVSATGLSVGQLVLVDHVTNSDPNVFWGLAHDPAGGGSRQWFCRQIDR